jgi:hypothetical protein
MVWLKNVTIHLDLSYPPHRDAKQFEESHMIVAN